MCHKHASVRCVKRNVSHLLCLEEHILRLGARGAVTDEVTKANGERRQTLE